MDRRRRLSRPPGLFFGGICNFLVEAAESWSFLQSKPVVRVAIFTRAHAEPLPERVVEVGDVLEADLIADDGNALVTGDDAFGCGDEAAFPDEIADGRLHVRAKQMLEARRTE